MSILAAYKKIMYQLLNFNNFCFSKIQKLRTILDLIALGQKTGMYLNLPAVVSVLYEFLYTSL